MSNRINYGMVGGGESAFIGKIHRTAANITNNFNLVSGVFSANPKNSKLFGNELNLSNDRCYSDFQEMAIEESYRDDGIEAVVIVTPNNLHIPVAEEFLKKGIHVICDKPIATNIIQTRPIKNLLKKTDKIFAVTYNYSGYPLVRYAKKMIESGEIGEIRSIQLEYAQDWLFEKIENAGQKQALWRTDPFLSGPGGCLADIGTHAFHLLCFVLGTKPSQILTDLSQFVNGRILPDNANILFRFMNGATGMLWLSQVAPGKKNGLSLRVYGSKAGIEWAQENPNYLKFSIPNKHTIIRGKEDLKNYNNLVQLTRTPPGHPDGFIESFANIYQEISEAILDYRKGQKICHKTIFPNFSDGIDGMKFIEAAIKSNKMNSKWINLNYN
tara:strand:- start:210 stop:1361 length:1152 start_codon:yes stop_codon:yes gene_type:complete